MDTSLIVNSTGLILDIIGASLIFVNSQKVRFQTFFYSEEVNKKLALKARKMNKRAKYGLLIVIFGFCLQLISNFL